MPVVMYNDSRLLPQTFRGAWLNSADVDNLSLDFGRLDQTKLRNSSDNEDMSVYNGVARNIRLGRHATSDRFDFAGATYRWTPSLSTAYHYGELEGIYRQHLPDPQPQMDDQRRADVQLRPALGAQPR